MRNTYTLFDYGNFMENTAVDRGDPFIQLLPLTDASAAHKDFVQVRLNGIDTTGDSAHALLPASQMKHSPISEAEKKKQYVRDAWLHVNYSDHFMCVQVRGDDPQSLALHLRWLLGVCAHRDRPHRLALLCRPPQEERGKVQQHAPSRYEAAFPRRAPGFVHARQRQRDGNGRQQDPLRLDVPRVRVPEFLRLRPPARLICPAHTHVHGLVPRVAPCTSVKKRLGLREVVLLPPLPPYLVPYPRLCCCSSIVVALPLLVPCIIPT